MLPAAPQNEKKTEIIYIFKSKTQLLHKVKTGSSKTKEKKGVEKEIERQRSRSNQSMKKLCVHAYANLRKPQSLRPTWRPSEIQIQFEKWKRYKFCAPDRERKREIAHAIIIDNSEGLWHG